MAGQGVKFTLVQDEDVLDTWFSSALWPFATLAAVLGHLGRGADAAAAIADLLGLRPGYTRARAREDLFFCADGAFVDRYLDGLGRAGLPA